MLELYDGGAIVLALLGFAYLRLPPKQVLADSSGLRVLRTSLVGDSTVLYNWESLSTFETVVRARKSVVLQSRSRTPGRALRLVVEPELELGSRLH